MTGRSSRSREQLANSAVGVAAVLVEMALNYAVRIVLVRQLGAELNGLHSLFQSLVGVLSLLEGGFGTAMVVHLYGPVEREDREAIRRLVRFYRGLYRRIAAGFLLAGLAVDLLWLDRLVTSSLPAGRVRLYFFLFILSFSAYFATYYKRSLLFARQKNRVSTLATLAAELVCRTAQLAVLLTLRDYGVFLVLMLLEKVGSNLLCSRYLRRTDPELDRLGRQRTEPELKASVYRTVRPLLVYNIANTVQQSARSILISALLGNVSLVGCYGNYALVTNGVLALYNQLGAAYTSAVGSLAASGGGEELYAYCRRTAHWMDWLSITLGAGIMACSRDFIALAFGADYVLPGPCVAVLTADLLAYLLAVPVVSVQNALGLHHRDRGWMVVQTVLAVLLGYLGGRLGGLFWLLLGLLLPQIVLTTAHKGVLIYREVFHRPGGEWLLRLARTSLRAASVTALAVLLTGPIATGSVLLDFLCRGTLTVALCGLLFGLELLLRRRI